MVRPLNIPNAFPFSGRHNEVCAKEVLRHFLALDPENLLDLRVRAPGPRERRAGARLHHLRDVGGAQTPRWIEMQQMDEEKMDAARRVPFFDW